MTAPDIATPTQQRTFLAILSAIEEGHEVSANLLHDDAHHAAQLPANSLGGLFRGGCLSGYLAPCGYTTSRAASRRGGVIRTYRRTGKAVEVEG